MKEELWQRKGVKSSETAGKMAFRGYRKPNKHKEAKTKPTQAKLATRRKRQRRRKTTRPTKRTGNKHRIRTQIAAGRALEGNPVAAFSAYFLWEMVNWRTSKTPRNVKTAPKKTEFPRGPKSSFRF